MVHPPSPPDRAGTRPHGRPSALTPDAESRILNAVRCGAPNKTACAAAGIGESTLYGWLERARAEPGSDYAAFAEKLARARQEGIAARLALIQKAAVKDWRAAAWLLERDLPEEFSLRFKVEHAAAEPTFAQVLAKLRGDRAAGLLEDPGDPDDEEIDEQEETTS